jgi:hypothetical protein
MNWGGRLIGAVSYESELMALRVNGRLNLTRLDPELDPEAALHPNRGVLAADSQVELCGAVIGSGVNYPGGPRFIWSARVPRNYEAVLEERLKFVVAPGPGKEQAPPAKTSPAPRTKKTAPAPASPQTARTQTGGQPSPPPDKGRPPRSS